MTNGSFVKSDPLLREEYFYHTHKSGLRIIVIPKKFGTEFAGVGVGFGARDNRFLQGDRECRLPLGCAHFLEHKMFESKNGEDAFSLFEKYGGNANAYTSFENTCFYFSCTKNFCDNLNVLLETVTTPCFTAASVKKERGIISEEIRMYEDSPGVRVSQELMRAMYFSHPVREPISGSVDSVAEIDKKVLMRCADSFYVPSNMVLAVCTHRDPMEIVSVADRFFAPCDKKRPITLYEKEPEQVVSPLTKSSACVASPLFGVGFKCRPLGTDLAALKKATALRMAISMMFGRASDFYCRSYESKLVNERFSVSFECSEGLSYLGIGGSSSEPLRLAEAVTEELEFRKENFFGQEEFLREKKAAYAGAMMLFDSPEDIVTAYISNCLQGFDEFQYMEAIRSTTLEQCRDAFLEIIDTKNRSISIIEPK